MSRDADIGKSPRRRCGLRIVQDTRLRLDDQQFLRIDGPQPQPGVFERRRGSHEICRHAAAIRSTRGACQQQRVDPPRDLQFLLQPGQRNEDRPHRRLLGLERKLTQHLGSDDGLDGQAHRAPEVLLASVQRFERHV